MTVSESVTGRVQDPDLDSPWSGIQVQLCMKLLVWNPIQVSTRILISPLADQFDSKPEEQSGTAFALD